MLESTDRKLLATSLENDLMKADRRQRTCYLISTMPQENSGSNQAVPPTDHDISPDSLTGLY